MQSSTVLSIVGLILWSLATASSAQDKAKVLIVGDSLSAAYNMAIEESWPSLLQSSLDQKGHSAQLINASISGETTTGGLERLPALLEREQPTHMILELGGNDGLRGFPFKRSEGNLSRMIEMALQRDINVLLIGVRLPPNLGPVYNSRFQQMYQRLADSYAVTYLPRFLEGVAASGPGLMQADGIHPTAEAQPILADKVYLKLVPLLAANTGQ